MRFRRCSKGCTTRLTPAVSKPLPGEGRSDAGDLYRCPPTHAHPTALELSSHMLHGSDNTCVARSNPFCPRRCFRLTPSSPPPSDFNYAREPNVDERHKFSRDIYRVEDSQLAEAVGLLEQRCPEAVVRVSTSCLYNVMWAEYDTMLGGRVGMAVET